MIILIADKHEAFGPPIIIILMDPLSPNLIGGYDLVISITSSFYGLNNLEILIYKLRKEKRSTSKPQSFH